MNNNTPRIPDAIDSQKLAFMQMTAKMKESADKYGAGFIGGFVASDGEIFTMTNLEEEEDVMNLFVQKFFDPTHD
jgi:hypothetical protein